MRPSGENLKRCESAVCSSVCRALPFLNSSGGECHELKFDYRCFERWFGRRLIPRHRTGIRTRSSTDVWPVISTPIRNHCPTSEKRSVTQTSDSSVVAAWDWFALGRRTIGKPMQIMGYHGWVKNSAKPPNGITKSTASARFGTDRVARITRIVSA